MSLKQLVNNKEVMDDFIKHLDDLIYIQHKVMEQSDNPIAIHRAQGSISTLKRLKLLKETVNGG